MFMYLFIYIFTHLCNYLFIMDSEETRYLSDKPEPDESYSHPLILDPYDPF